MDHLKAFCFGPTVIFLMKRSICFLLLLTSFLFLSLFILTRAFWPRSFKPACHFPLLELQGSFQWTRSGFMARSPRDAPHLAWPSTSHFAFCYWVNLLLSNFLAKRSLCNITHRSNLTAREMLSGAWALLYSLCWHTRGLEEAMKSFTLTICLTGHIASSPPPKQEPWRAMQCASSSSPSVFNRADRSVSWGALEQGVNVCFQPARQSVVLDPVWSRGELEVEALVWCHFKADRQREKSHTFKGFSKMWLPWDFWSRNIMSGEVMALFFQPDIQFFFS